MTVNSLILQQHELKTNEMTYFQFSMNTRTTHYVVLTLPIETTMQ